MILDGHVVVVRLPNWLGDTVMALPALAALRAARPDALVTVIGPWAPLLTGQAVADVHLRYPRAGHLRRKLGALLREMKPDVA
ncbi:MAG TPA: lipopolysaccharide heptosyltransferase II, partial [Methylomirabilota bacterium]|nr:lipopolysaccharide heptosyltransferase II [Methylomirabilota bacterium]